GLGDGSHGVDNAAYELKPSEHSSHGVLLDWLGRAGPARVLDVGCSDGEFAALVRAQGHHVTGVDLVEHEGVRDRVDAFVRADLNAGLPEETGTGYDLVIAGDVLEHVIDPHSLLSDLRDRLAAGGEVLVSVPN